MPIIQNENYQRPKWLFNRHLETIYPALFRTVNLQKPVRERIITDDKDFLDLDWYKQESPKLVIINHGLEGNSSRSYILGMAKTFLENKFDVLAWNYRGCGDELNQTPIFYHSGATYDLNRVIEHASPNYEEIYLVGFSLGGNLTLKYMGENGTSTRKIKKAVAISVPLHLSSSSQKISEIENTLYSKRFLKTLKEKVQLKAKIHPNDIPVEMLRNVRTLAEFDNYLTGPLHGFADAEEYYEVNSSLYFLDKINKPTLVLNAWNDPFLSKQCFPIDLAKKLEKVYFEFPKNGGHVGFTNKISKNPYYSEQRAVEFITQDI